MKTFKELNKGKYFTLNGNIYQKRSSRTADLIGKDRWFYFGKDEVVSTTDKKLEAYNY